MELTFQVAIFVIARFPAFFTPVAMPTGAASRFYRKRGSSANLEASPVIVDLQDCRFPDFPNRNTGALPEILPRHNHQPDGQIFTTSLRAVYYGNDFSPGKRGML